jgi:ABC-type transport system involved in cytochrome c biogenesis ATPase subunit
LCRVHNAPVSWQWKDMTMQADGLSQGQQANSGAGSGAASGACSGARSETAPVVVAAQALGFGHPGLPLWEGASHTWRAGLNLVRGGEGCGKTSLLQALAGQLRLRSGRFDHPWTQGRPPSLFWKDPRAALAQDECRRPALEWVQSQAASHPGWDASAWQAHVQGLGLAPHLSKPLLALSTGSLRKLWMAAGWACGSELLLIDEPLAALDRASMDHVQHTLAGMNWAGQRRAGTAPRCVIVAHWDAMQGVAWDDILDLPEQGPLR